MRKAISLFVASALCLSLCACGVAEQYKPLLEHLENQNYEGIRNEMMVLSPDFAAEQEQMEKYQSLIDALEAEDYETAFADVESRIPTPEYEIIEITMENWEEYFEIVPDHYWITNAFGEGKGLTVGFSLFLKDVYASRLSQTDNSTIACTVSFDAREKTLDVNWNETTFTEAEYDIGAGGGMGLSPMDGGRDLDYPFEEACGVTSKLNAKTMVPPTNDDRFVSNLFCVNRDRREDRRFYNFYYSENIEMVRITGTLELIVE